MKVLIPVDGSDQSLRTIRGAARFLEKGVCEIYLLNVRLTLPSEVNWALMKDQEATIELLNAAKLEAMKAGLKVEKSEYVTFPDPAAAICDYAKEMQIDLIVIGSHGYRGLAEFLMGSVSEKVFEKADRPVIVIRNDREQSVELIHFKESEFQHSEA